MRVGGTRAGVGAEGISGVLIAGSGSCADGAGICRVGFGSPGGIGFASGGGGGFCGLIC